MEQRLDLSLNEDDMTIDEAEALWALKIITSDELPKIALDILEDGMDTPEIRLLAGLTKADIDDAASLFEKVLEKMNRPKISLEQALGKYIVFISKKIINKELSPFDGAYKIWDASLNVPSLNDPMNSNHDADPFIYCASEYQERPEDRKLFDEAIIKSAKIWATK